MNIKELYESSKEKRAKAKALAEKEKRRKIEIEKQKRKEHMDDILKDIEEDQKFKDTVDRIRVNTYTKKMVAIIIGISLIDLQLSYVLAFLGKMQIAESLSERICVTILGVAFVYMVRAYFDSKAEHSNLDSKIKDELEEGLNYKIKDILQESGMGNINVETFFKSKSNNKSSNDSNDIHPGFFYPNNTEKDEIKPPSSNSGLVG